MTLPTVLIVPGLRDAVPQHWQTLLRELTPQLQALVDQDRGTPESADARVRIGMYSFSAPLNAAIGAPAAGYVSPPQSLRREKS